MCNIVYKLSRHYVVIVDARGFIMCLCLPQKIPEQGVMRLLSKTACQNLSMCCIPAPLDSPSLWTDYEKVVV